MNENSVCLCVYIYPSKLEDLVSWLKLYTNFQCTEDEVRWELNKTIKWSSICLKNQPLTRILRSFTTFHSLSRLSPFLMTFENCTMKNIIFIHFVHFTIFNFYSSNLLLNMEMIPLKAITFLVCILKVSITKNETFLLNGTKNWKLQRSALKFPF